MTKFNFPYVILKSALSLDGYYDDSSAKRRVFSGALDKAAVDALRASCDAIFVGGETLRADNASLRVRSEELCTERLAQGKPAQPRRVTITASGNFESSLKFFSSDSGDAELPLVFSQPKAEKQLRDSLGQNAEIVLLPPEPSLLLPFILERLYEFGVRRLLVEGGARLHSLFLDSDIADEVRLAYAPIFLGAEGASGSAVLAKDFSDYNLDAVEKLGEMSVLTYRRSPSRR